MNEKADAAIPHQLRACGSCKFSSLERMPPPELQSVRVCKRFPPSLFVIQAQHGIAMNVAFPIVADQLWCYEYAPDSAANS